MLRKKKSAAISVEIRAADSLPATFEEFLEQRQGQDLLRLITCGSAGDGKSTLIGRLLRESQQLFDDRPVALVTDPKKRGTPLGNVDFTLLPDGPAVERGKRISVDVAYRFFATGKRMFMVADAPGHESYTRNMVAGASTADAALLLVDARLGMLAQTRRHAYLASLMGIRHVVLAVNKMDLVGFDREAFKRGEETFRQFARSLDFETITAIPLSALKGDNVVRRSPNMPWYAGPTLKGYLETVRIARGIAEKLVFPVQWFNRPDATFRGFSGSVAQGQIRVGDEIRVTASGQTANVAEIVSMDGSLAQAVAGDAVTLRLGSAIDAARGDVFSSSASPIEASDQFEATLVWMNEDPGLVGRSYDIKLATQWASASITRIKHRVDTDTLAHEASSKLALNDIGVCNLATSKSLALDRYQNSKTLGGFILVDRLSHATVAAGMILHSLRRAQNVHRQPLTVARPDREILNGHRGRVVWFTGLSGAGKSTIANALEVELHAQGRRTYVLDGDNIRIGLNRDLGFTDADRVENIRRIAEVAKLMMDAGLIVMTAFISPFRREREMARELIGPENFVEVYVSTPLEICEQRDAKGLYKKARSGDLPNMTGIGSPYEAPERPDITLDCGDTPVRAAVNRLIEALKV